MNKNFTHLHLHTEYSLLDGVGKIDEYLDRCKELGMSSMAVTDHGNMFCAIDFYKKAIKKGIKPVIGIEAYIGEKKEVVVTEGIKAEKVDTKEVDRKSYHIILLAKNNKGYKNIMKISSYAYTEGFYYRPRVTKEFLKEHSEGVIALSACMAGEISALILSKAKESEIDNKIIEYKEIFKDGFYIEIQGNGVKEQKELNLELLTYAKKHKLEIVITNDTHYVNSGEHKLQDLLICIQTGAKVQDVNRMKIETEELYLKSREQMLESCLFTKRDIENWSLKYNRDLKSVFKEKLYNSEDYDENLKKLVIDLNNNLDGYLDNSNKIADSCSVKITFGEFKFPKYKVPENFVSTEEYLEHLILTGLEKRLNGNILEEYRVRADYEFSVIKKMGYSEYFVVVWDFINYAKNQGIAIGPGRGSAAGSLVSYALGITDLDPLEYNLIFERFLNPERISMPDIDIDICGERRQEVINYVIDKYGADHVAQIITFGRMKARAAVRDIGRVMDIPLVKIDKLAKLLPADFTLDKSINLIPEVKDLYINDLELQEVLDYAKSLENTVRHASIHAAGVVITGEPLTENIPLYMDNREKIISTQYQMKEVEELGILKMDFLGLRNLTILQKVQKIIKENRGKEYVLSEIPLNNEKTFEMLSKGDTSGVFQLESRGIRNLIIKMKPDRFEDIIALLALYRPGPLGSGMVESFINCKNRNEEISYPDESLEEVLKETYGVILYQEQVMKIAAIMADYTLGEADNLRRAMGKKDVVLMENNRNMFVDRAKGKGYSPEKSAYIFDLIDKFAGYGFNKSHSAAYALIAYWTAYFKSNYPLEFYTGILSCMDQIENIAYYIEDAKVHDIELILPNVNRPSKGFSIEKNRIKFSISGVKNVGEGFVENLIEDTNSDGEYKTFEEFAVRMKKKGLNKKVLYSLICSGALDSIPGNRKQKLESIDKVLDYSERVSREDEIQQMNLFGEAKGILNRFNLPNLLEYEVSQVIELEKEVMGFYFSAHPLDAYRNLIKAYQLIEIGEILEEKKVQHIKTYGIIEEVKKIVTKKDGKIMASFKLAGYYSNIMGIIFPKDYEANFEHLIVGNPIIIKGVTQIDYFNDQETVKIVARDIISMKNVSELYRGHCDILLDIDNDREKFNRLKEIINLHKGTMKLNYWNSKDKCRIVTSSVKISPSKAFIDEVVGLLGIDKILIKI